MPVSTQNHKDYVVPLLVLFFIFLLFVLGISFYLQGNRALSNYQRAMESTLDSYVSQAAITSRAVIKVTDMLVNNQYSNLVNFLHGDKSLGSEIEMVMAGNAYNYRGFMLFDGDRQLQYDSQDALSAAETTFIQEYLLKSLRKLDLQSEIFGAYFGGPSGLYTATAIKSKNRIMGYFVIRRPYAAYANSIRLDQYPGFSLWLLDRASSNVLIGEGQLFEWDEPVKLNTLADERRIFSRKAIEGTPWDVVALPKQDYILNELLSLALPKLFFLLLYALLAIWTVRYVRRVQNHHGEQLDVFAQQSERAEQALSYIREAVITTDIKGRILYLNSAATQWVRTESGAVPDEEMSQFSSLLSADHHQRQPSVVGKRLKSVFQLSGARWMQKWDVTSLQSTEGQPTELFAIVKGAKVNLRITHHLFKNGKNKTAVVWVIRNVTQQVADRELLEENRARYHALYEGAGVGMWHVDITLVRTWLEGLSGIIPSEYLAVHPREIHRLRAAFQLMDVNLAAVRTAGLTSKEKLKAVANTLFKGRNQNLLVCVANALFLKKESISLEAEVNDIEGVPRHYVVNVTFDTVGQDQALISFIDISDRIAAEKAVKQSEQFWSSVIQALPDTVYVNDLIEKNTVFVSRHVAELIGYSEQEAKQVEHWKALTHPDDQQKLTASIQTLRNMKAGEVLETELRLKHRNGSWRVMRFRDCVFTTNEKHESKLYVGMGRDVTEENDARVQLAYSERQYRVLAQSISDIVITLDSHLELTFVSPSVEKILGVQPSQVMREGLQMIFAPDAYRRLEVLGRKDIHDAVMHQQQRKNHHKIRSIDLLAQTFSGEPVILEVQASILRDEEGRVEGLLAIGRDVTQRRAIEQEVRTAAEVFENSSEAIVVTDVRGHIQRVNRAFSHMTGYQLAEVKSKDPIRFLSPTLSRAVRRNIIDALVHEGYWQGEVSYRTQSGEMRPSWTGVTALKDDMGKVQSHIVISSDITERKVSEARIQRLAYYDPLTELPNRSQMHEKLDHLMKDPRRSVALLFIDLDRFKPINDTMGHPVGDQVLVDVAHRLRHAIREQDLVARIGGDEFTIIMPGFEDTQAASHEAIQESERILQRLMKPFTIKDRQLFLSASIGVALFPKDADNGTDLLRNADTAMYYAKAMGKNNFQFYAEEMNVKAMERLELENNLHQALRRDEFEIYYQPQLDTNRNEICGIEALLRWRRPHHGLVGPDLFVPIIEETGLIVPVGEWVLRKVCEQIIEWQEEGLVVPTFAVNLSARQFKDEQMLDRICRIVNETGVDPELIELELTESILMDDVQRTLAVLNEARKMGFHISIDDFGTGYSSLSYLKQFPVDNLKIDQSFIKNLPYNQEDAQITRTIVAMANILGLGVIAEGVETLEQQLFLQEVGCHRVQGYRYSRPVQADYLAETFLESEALLEVDAESDRVI